LPAVTAAAAINDRDVKSRREIPFGFGIAHLRPPSVGGRPAACRGLTRSDVRMGQA
jgi:hypothetical protein